MPPDLLQRLIAPLRDEILLRLAGGRPAPVGAAVESLLDLGGLALIAIVLARAGGLVVRRFDPTAPSRAAMVVRAAAVVVAVGLFAWIVRHPSPYLDGLFTRWDHLVFCAVAGLALVPAPLPLRKFALAGVGITLMMQYYGLRAIGLVGVVGVMGVAVLRTPLAERPWALVSVQGLLIASAYVYLLRLHHERPGAASAAQGVMAYAMLRHISFIVVASKKRQPWLDYAAFMGFYPAAGGVFGASEVYAEFSRRNLTRARLPDYERAARRLIVGCLQAWIALRIPVSADTVVASPGAAVAWATTVVFFLKTALALMGGWAMIEGAALFFGVQLRTNFHGLLTTQDPSELWWSWRASLTNWLVLHVYAPLGGRRNLTRNILATFAVSFLWHAVGLPFITTDFHLAQVAPVALWATINGGAVLAHSHLSGTGVAGAGGRRSLIQRAIRTVLMWPLAAMSPLLLSFQGEAFARFPALLRVLLGLR